MTSSGVVRYRTRAQWDAQPELLAVTDKIIVRNLQANVNAGVDVWNREKQQRALITVTLSLAKPFESAAQSDALDNSTVHYGKLSKDIQAHVKDLTSHDNTGGLGATIADQVQETAGNTPLASIEVDIFYPKGSMCGEGAGIIFASTPQYSMYNQLYLRNIRVPCLIGVNSNERERKQPVVVNVWIENVQRSRSDDYVELESAIVDVVSSSSFETLESLSTTVVQRLRDNFFTQEEDKHSVIRLKIEKPHAVPAADAPAIEILRPVRP